jgi:hypothetical protein
VQQRTWPQAVVRGSATCLAALASLSCGDSGTASTPQHPVSLSPARAFRAFPVYYAGTVAGGLPLTDAGGGQLRGRLAGDQVDFVYGTCSPNPASEESGCTTPLAVTDVPSCTKNPALYRNGGPPSRATRLRGVPTRVFDEDGAVRIELYSRTTTVVVSADSEKIARRVVARLRGINTRTRIGDPLPAPRPSDLDGTAPCR